MKKYLFLLSFASSLAMAQPVNTINSNNPVSNTVTVIKGQHRVEIENFKDQERRSIAAHRGEMHIKREALKTQEEILIQDVEKAKSQGTPLTDEQKNAFIERHQAIKAQAHQLYEENETFKHSIDEQRMAFKQKIKSEEK